MPKISLEFISYRIYMNRDLETQWIDKVQKKVLGLEVAKRSEFTTGIVGLKTDGSEAQDHYVLLMVGDRT